MADVEATDALKQLGTQALQDLYNNLTQAKGFVLDQAPDFCQQIVAYAMVRNWSIVVLSVIGLFVGAYIVYRLGKYERECSGCDMPPIFASVFGGGALAGIVCLGLDAADTAIKATFAPKLYLVEYIAHLLK